MSDSVVGLLSVCGILLVLFKEIVVMLVEPDTVGSVAPTVESLPPPVESKPVAPVLSVFDVAPELAVGAVTLMMASDGFVVSFPFVVVLLVAIVVRVCADGSPKDAVPALTEVVEVLVVVPMGNVDALRELVVVGNKDVVGVAVDKDVLDVVSPCLVLAIVPFVVVTELVV